MLYDIIIIGGGMVGASLACSLQNTALRIALIDAAPLDVTDDHRLIALTYSSYCFFNHFHIWKKLSEYASPIEQVHVSDRGHFGKMRLHAKDVSLPALGYVVPAKNINTALNDELQQNNIHVIRPATLTALIQDENQATVTLQTASGEKKLSAKFIIGADGSYSAVRAQLNLKTKIVDYQQSALVTVTELQKPHQQIAFERFHVGGAIAMLPLTHRRVATIWSDQTEKIHWLMQLSDAEFLTTLQKDFGYLLGRFLQISQRYVYPLQMIQAEQTLQQRVLLIGNAAHTLSPLAAQGLNLALAEIAMLTETLSSQREDLENVNWDNYLIWQKTQQTTSTYLSHHLPRLFSADFFPVSLARQMGLIGVDICPPLKRQFIQRALGRNKKLPRLLTFPLSED